MDSAPPLALVREAFEAARERHFWIARILYPLIFGGAWRSAILLFSYLKCLDDLVDEDPDQAHALAVLECHRALIERRYRGDDVGESAGPERFAIPVFALDRRRGAALRRPIEEILVSMEFDTRRRGARLAATDLDAYVVGLGRSVFNLFCRLAAPSAVMAEDLVVEGSRAYLYADALIDLQADLGFGVINIPREDIARLALSCRPDDSRLRGWVAARVPVILAHFARASARLKTFPPWRLRCFLRLFLASKQRKLLRHLKLSGRPPGSCC